MDKICPLLKKACIEEKCEFMSETHTGISQFVYDDKIERYPAKFKTVKKRKYLFITVTEQKQILCETAIVTRIGHVVIATKSCKFNDNVKVVTREFQRCSPIRETLHLDNSWKIKFLSNLITVSKCHMNIKAILAGKAPAIERI